MGEMGKITNSSEFRIGNRNGNPYSTERRVKKIEKQENSTRVIFRRF